LVGLTGKDLSKLESGKDFVCHLGHSYAKVCILDSENSWTLCLKTCLKGGGGEGEKTNLTVERQVEQRKRFYNLTVLQIYIWEMIYVKKSDII